MCGDVRQCPLRGPFGFLVALQVFQHGTSADGESATRIAGYVQAEAWLALCAWLLYRWLGPTATRVAALGVAVEWLLLGLSLEALIGRARGLSWPELAARFHPVTGTWDSLIVAASLFLVPLVVGLWLTSGSGPGQRSPQGGPDPA